jgi:voltage-gated potassium channel
MDPNTESLSARNGDDNASAAHRDSEAASPGVAHRSHPSWRRRTYDIIEIGRGEDRASRIFDAAIVSLIILNTAAVVAETVPSIHAQYGVWLRGFEVLAVAVFTIEYVLRLWTAVETPFLSRLKPCRARLTFAKSPALIIDLLAILPFYLHHLVPIDLGILRMLRLMRFLKLSRYSPAMHTLVRVLQNEQKALIGAALLLLTALLFSSTLMFHLEAEAQPEKFGSIPSAAWWAITTLTTVGYGDATPVTTLGRLLAGLTMVMGLCILALPVAIISTGFAQEVHRRDFVVNWSLMSRVPLLAKLDAKEAAEIMPLLHAHNLPPNVEIASKGAPADAIYFVASGSIDQHGDKSKSRFNTGDVFGASAMLNNDVHAGHVFTSSRSRLLKLHREDFHRIELRHPAVAARIRRMANMQHEVEELATLQDGTNVV